MNKSLIKIQQYYLTNNLPFVSYTMLGSNEPISLFPNNNEVFTYPNFSEIGSISGFIMAPFQDELFDTIVIPDTNTYKGWDFEFNIPIENAFNNTAQQPSNHYITSKEEYEQQVLDIKNHLINGKAYKVVLSRIKKYDASNVNFLPYLFEELVNTYPNAFVYIISTPKTGIWIGATPETLVQTTNQTFNTIALAGTKAVTTDNNIGKWSDKNLKEQEYVEEHLRHCLKQGAYNFTETERQTIKAGNVEHLGTFFNGQTKGLQNEWKQLVNLLYPTPAICGTDNKASLAIIREVEKHNRSYYTGFLGPVQNNIAHLFINLRCLQYANQCAYFYAGGGIINESVESKEWNETELKFNTLGAVLEKVLNNYSNNNA